MKTYHRALTIAGSDSGGGAGIQADLKTFAALQCYGMSVITALTAQNTIAVTAIQQVSPDFIGAQLDAVFTDIGVDAVKIGMLHTPQVIEVVAAKLRLYRPGMIVVDPVMVAKSGDKLLQPDAVQALKTELLPLATLITPNLPEAAVLLDRPVAGHNDMPDAARDLAKLGCDAVLLKGGHLCGTTSTDVLFMPQTNERRTFEQARIDTPNSHGTGCTLSAATAALLARGYDLAAAVGRAKTYISDALQAGADYKIGAGHGPVHHFHHWWQ